MPTRGVPSQPRWSVSMEDHVVDVEAARTHGHANTHTPYARITEIIKRTHTNMHNRNEKKHEAHTNMHALAKKKAKENITH